MSQTKSFAELRQIAAKQTETIRQQNEILASQNRELQMKAQHLEMERMQYEASKHADIRHQVNQCVDFALKSLPWWNRNPKAVVERASTLLLTIKHETAKHVAMDVLAQKIQDENKPIEEVKAETEKLLDGIMADRETAEMETL